MSENIQSISQGTYTIGQTSATNYVAGPGISITQPSEGTVRIANDETVLWSGNFPYTGGQNTSAVVQLSEGIENFDRIRVYYSAGAPNQGLVGQLTEFSYLNTNIKRIVSDTTAGGYIGFFQYCPTYSSFSYQCGYGTNPSGMHTAYLGADWGYGRPCKIIGINRISGSNA